MRRIYKLNSVLCKTSRMLLDRVFVRIGIEKEQLQRLESGRSYSAHLRDYIETLSPVLRRKIDIVCKDIYELSCKEGIDTIERVASMCKKKHWCSPFLTLYGKEASDFSKATWAWLEYPDIFEDALEAKSLGELSWWRPRTNLKCREERLHMQSTYQPGWDEILMDEWMEDSRRESRKLHDIHHEDDYNGGHSDETAN